MTQTPEAEDSTPAQQTPPAEMDFEEFQRIYGRVQALTPAGAGLLFEGAPFRWWVAGGWSTELEEKPRRFHEDLEIGLPRGDIPEFRRWLREYHIWDVGPHGLRYLETGDSIPEEHEQLWVRRDAYAPWLMDVMLTPVEGDTWFYKRDRRISMPVESVIRVGDDGVPYQSPEITLLFKARRRFEKDEADFTAVFPKLSLAQREWLQEAIALTEPPGNPWLKRLGGG